MEPITYIFLSYNFIFFMFVYIDFLYNNIDEYKTKFTFVRCNYHE